MPRSRYLRRPFVAAGFALAALVAGYATARAAGSPAAPATGATPIPSASNPPAVDMSQYEPYRPAGRGSLAGTVAFTTDDGIREIAHRVPVYLLPATAYTAWYVALHAHEFENALERAGGGKRRGLGGLIARDTKSGSSGPDLTKPIAFTPIDPRVFAAARVTKTDDRGRFAFDGLPAGSYFVLTHWTFHTAHPVVVAGREFGDPDASEQLTAETEGHVEIADLHYLALLESTAPQTVRDGDRAAFVATGGAGTLLVDSCSTLPCRMYVIDQWLPAEQRL